MMATFEIPLIASPQQFSVQLAGVTYNMTLQYHPASAGVSDAPTGQNSNSGTFVDTNDLSQWCLDIADVNAVPLVCGIPLVPQIDLLLQYKYLRIGGQLFVISDGDPGAMPTFDNLGSGSHLYFVVA